MWGVGNEGRTRWYALSPYIGHWKMDLLSPTSYILPPTSFPIFLRSYSNQFNELNHANWGPLGADLSQKKRGLCCDGTPRNAPASNATKLSRHKRR